MDIHILDEALINKIAAGEVIERPASIIKELIENSIDANSTQIFIDVKEAGKTLIKVSDNGDGMDKKNASISWHRHTTSKIQGLKDLFSIHTLGFRGEALASVAAVSKLTIITKKEDELGGTKIIVQAGKESLNESVGCSKGTQIIVENLFFNTPARKKYLKSIDIEIRHIIDIVTRYALINNEIHFILTHNGKELLNSPSTRIPIKNIGFIYGQNSTKNLIELDYQKSGYHITGFISKPSLSKSTRNEQSIYVNRRYIKKNQVISDAINDAFRTLVMVNRYPVCILNIDMDNNRTDVNVHPQKSEIRIADENVLYEVVYSAIRSTIHNNDLIPETLSEEKEKKLDEFPELDIQRTEKVIFKTEKIDKYYPVEDSSQKLLRENDDITDNSRLPEMRILGIINKTYIITETQGNIIIIDQHAAAERILYERFTQELRKKKVTIQELLDPAIIELNSKQFSVVVNNISYLKELGYSVEEFGINTILIRTIPVLLGKNFDKSLFLDFISELESNKTLPTLEKFFHDKIARMSCRTAIKAGDNITLPQIKEYIKELDQNNVYTCPHGRPIMIRWSMYELEKMFKRVV